MGVKPTQLGSESVVDLAVFSSHRDHPDASLEERVGGVLSIEGGQLGVFVWNLEEFLKERATVTQPRGPRSPGTGVLWGGGGGGWMSLRICGGAQM